MGLALVAALSYSTGQVLVTDHTGGTFGVLMVRQGREITRSRPGEKGRRLGMRNALGASGRCQCQIRAC
jgi:hypothetical protein